MSNVEFPFYVYQDIKPWGQVIGNGAPSGWMGDHQDLIMDLGWKQDVFEGDTCIRITYKALGLNQSNWAGMMWQNPPNNTGSVDGGVNLKGAQRLTFWARGERGGEVIDCFKIGGTLGYYPDTDAIATTKVRLTREWTQYSISLHHLDLSYISSFFSWVANRYDNPEGFVIYLDEIRIEGTSPQAKGNEK